MIETSQHRHLPVPPEGFSHWMLAEIFEQAETLRRTLDHYVEGCRFRAEVTEPARRWLQQGRRGITLAASGSSRHAALVAALRLEATCGIDADVQYASEFAYRSLRASDRKPVAVISQSGETADTLAALHVAAAQGRPTLAITNVEGSSMDRAATVRWPTLAGRERAVPATKSFTAQLLALQLLSVLAGEDDTMATAAALRALGDLPASVAAQLTQWQAAAARAAEVFRDASSAMFLGRESLFPIALEGALKLAETSYIPAQGLPGGELKHGPNALVSPGTPLVLLMTHDLTEPGAAERYKRMLDLLHDMLAQGATVVAVCNAEDEQVQSATPFAIPVGAAPALLLPILTVIPLQLLAYSIAAARGMPIDRPRNLSKAVLAE